MKRSSLVLRIVVPTLAMVAAIGQLAYLDALTGRLIASGPTSVGHARAMVVTAAAAHAVLSVVSGVLATVIVLRRSIRRPGARALGLAIGAWSYLLAYPGIVVLLRPDPGPLRIAFETHFLLVETVGLAALLRFTTVFPEPPRTAPDVVSEGSAAKVARLLRPARSALERPAVLWGIALLLPPALVGVTTANGAPTADAGLHPLLDVFRVAVAAAVVLNLRDSWARAGPDGRIGMTWLLAAFSALVSSVLVVIGGNILVSATAWSDPPFVWRPILLDLGVLAFVAGLAATQLAPDAVSPARAARRIATGTCLVMTVLLAATVLEVLLSSGIFGPVALPPGLGAAMAAAAIGSVSGPLLHFFGRLVDQWPGFAPAGDTPG